MSTPRLLQYLVCDFENTGLDPKTDAIIEVAVVGLDRNLDELFEYETLVYTTPENLAKIEANDYLRAMHTGNGLLAALKAEEAAFTLPSLAQVEQTILGLMGEHPWPKQKPQLAGSGVGHHDHPFIKEQMPLLAESLFYSTADAGVARRMYLNATGSLLTEIDQAKTHRSMDDVRCHIEELRAFFDAFRQHEETRAHGLPVTRRQAAYVLAEQGHHSLIDMGGWANLADPDYKAEAQAAYTRAARTDRVEVAAIILGLDR